MPTGVYIRSEHQKSAMAARINTPAAKANATAARKLARPRQTGYVLQGRRTEKLGTLHRKRAERALGKLLPVKAQVHHPDGDKTNPHARLVICQDAAYHHLLHFRMRIHAAGGNPNTDRICSRCKLVKDMAHFKRCHLRKADGLSNFCKQCTREKDRIYRANVQRKCAELA